MSRRLDAEPFVPLIGIVGLLALWYLAVKTRVSIRCCSRCRPTPPRRAWKGLNGGKLGVDFLITLQRTGLAIALASAIGIPVGLILGASEKLYRSLEFVVDFFRSTPATAIFPLFLLLFGVDDKTKIYVALSAPRSRSSSTSPMG